MQSHRASVGHAIGERQLRSFAIDVLRLNRDRASCFIRHGAGKQIVKTADEHTPVVHQCGGDLAGRGVATGVSHVD